VNFLRDTPPTSGRSEDLAQAGPVHGSAFLAIYRLLGSHIPDAGRRTRWRFRNSSKAMTGGVVFGSFPRSLLRARPAPSLSSPSPSASCRTSPASIIPSALLTVVWPYLEKAGRRKERMGAAEDQSVQPATARSCCRSSSLSRRSRFWLKSQTAPGGAPLVPTYRPGRGCGDSDSRSWTVLTLTTGHGRSFMWLGEQILGTRASATGDLADHLRRHRRSICLTPVVTTIDDIPPPDSTNLFRGVACSSVFMVAVVGFVVFHGAAPHAAGFPVQYAKARRRRPARFYGGGETRTLPAGGVKHGRRHHPGHLSALVDPRHSDDGWPR